MTDQSRAPVRPPVRTLDLSPQERRLVEIMRECQFGRIENVAVKAGQPILNNDVRVIRIATLGSRGRVKVERDEFELKKQVLDLFAELTRIDHGTVVRLEFRHGLPFLIEIAAPSRCSANGR